MKHASTAGRRTGDFSVILQTRASQAAIMVLKPGASSSDEPEDEHPQSEQWVYVIEGTGRAVAGRGRRRRIVLLQAGSLLLIEKREPHQITCTGRKPLVTVNLYVPPAYTKSGDLRR